MKREEWKERTLNEETKMEVDGARRIAMRDAIFSVLE